MKSLSVVVAVVAMTVMVAAFGAGCGEDAADHDGFSAAEWARIQSLSPLPAVADPTTTNKWADDPRAAAFGQRLYFDATDSGPLVVGDDGANGALGKVGETGKVSCNSCHNLMTGGTDQRAHPNNVSLGVDYGKRNTPSTINAAYYDWIGWSGSWDTIWSYTATVHDFTSFYGASRLAWAHTLYKKYRTDYEAIFPTPLDPALDPAAADAARFPPAGKPKAAMTADGPWEMMADADRRVVNTIIVNAGKALEAYVRKLLKRDAAFDAYVAGDVNAITPAAKRGLKLFIGKAACVACHSGPEFSDEKFHDTAINQAGPHVPAMDLGYYTSRGFVVANPLNGAGAFSDDPVAGARFIGTDMPDDGDKGAFRTKSLRDLTETAPYLHTGALATLADVVHYYNLGGDPSGYAGTKDSLMVPLNLSPSEESDLVEFLKTLTGQPLPGALLVDTSAK